MSDEKIKQLRGWGRLIAGTWPKTSAAIQEAADEIERLTKVENAALSWLRAVGPKQAKQMSTKLAEVLESQGEVRQ